MVVIVINAKIWAIPMQVLGWIYVSLERYFDKKVESLQGSELIVFPFDSERTEKNKKINGSTLGPKSFNFTFSKDSCISFL